MKTLWLAAVMLAALPQLVTAPPAGVDIREWNVPWPDTRPPDPHVDAKGLVWFVGQEGNYIARLDPATGKFERYALEAGTFPHNLIVDGKGMVWYAGNRNARIGRLDPATGAIVTYAMPDAAARDPHTLVQASDGTIWFTVQGGNFIGRLMPASGKVDLVKVPTGSARPYGITLDSRNQPWAALAGTNKLATVDSKTLTLREIELPRSNARVRRLVVTRDDRIWYADYMGGYIGQYDPATGKFVERALPSAEDSRPYAMVADSKDRLWIVETGPQPNVLVAFDTRSNAFGAATPIPSGARVVRHMYFHPETNQIWFGTDAGTIGRAQLD